MKKVAYTTIAVLAFWTVSRSQSPPTNTPATAQAPRPQIADEGQNFVIGPGDVLAIKVWKEPDLEAKVIVRPDGKIGMPLLNDVQAGGLTTTELRDSITGKLAAFFDEDPPLVYLDVVEINSQVVHILGAVPKPGPYSLAGPPLTVVELLARAGGLNEFTKGKKIQIVRTEGRVTTRFLFDYPAYEEGAFPQNIVLHAGDIVTVP